jgi:hypothetical protein
VEARVDLDPISSTRAAEGRPFFFTGAFAMKAKTLKLVKRRLKAEFASTLLALVLISLVKIGLLTLVPF